MKKNTHPTYHSKTRVKCACGNNFTIGSTKEKIDVEICSKCHPFYTGKKQLIDTAGRVEKFKARQKKAETVKPTTGKKVKKVSTKK